MLVASGGYYGTGGSLPITGVGFQPDLVILKSNLGSDRLAFYHGVAADVRRTFLSTDDPPFVTDVITAVGADGFTVGTRVDYNFLGNVIPYLALKAEGSDTELWVGSYVGDGNATQVISCGSVNPQMVFALGDNVTAPDNALQIEYMGPGFTAGHSTFLADGVDHTTHITAMGTGSFTVGITHNASGVTYYAFALADTGSGSIGIAQYTGTGVSRTVAHGATGTPTWAITLGDIEGDVWGGAGESGYVWSAEWDASYSHEYNLWQATVSAEITAVDATNVTLSGNKVNENTDPFALLTFVPDTRTTGVGRQISSVVDPSAFYGRVPAGVFMTSATVGYLAVMGTDDRLEVWKTGDGGYFWEQQDAANQPTAHGVVPAFVTLFDQEINGDAGAKLNFAWLTQTDDRLYFARFDTATDTWAAEVDVIGSSPGTVAAATDCQLSLVKTPGGNFSIAYRFDNTGTVRGVIGSSDSGATWVAQSASIMLASEDFFTLLPGLEADAQDYYCLYHDDSTNIATLYTYDDSADSWSAGTQVATGLGDGGASQPFAWAMRHSDDHCFVVYKSGSFPGTSAILAWDLGGEGSITAKTSPGTYIIPSIIIDQDSDDLYVSSATAFATGALQYQKSVDGGGSWSAPVEVDDNNDDYLPPINNGFVPAGLSAPPWLIAHIHDDQDDLWVNHPLLSPTFNAGGGGGGGGSARRALLGVG